NQNGLCGNSLWQSLFTAQQFMRVVLKPPQAEPKTELAGKVLGWKVLFVPRANGLLNTQEEINRIEFIGIEA
ncbi:MAG: hypothetical protein ABJ015_18745, partial [Rhodopirellula bahusiensis]